MNSIIIDFLKYSLNWDMNFLSSLEQIGGLSNNNYKAIYYNNLYFIRLCNPTPFNISRRNELTILHTACDLNLCHMPIYFDVETGNMVYKWINGKMPTEIEFNSERLLRKLCINLKKLHLTTSLTYFNPFNEIRARIKICINLKLPLPTYIYSLTEKLFRLEKELEINKFVGLCHNDLNVSNIIIDDRNLYIIDYEFSATCDVFFDLATVAWLQDYNGRVNLLKAYFGSFNIKDYNKLISYIYVVKLLNALWSLIKSAQSLSNYNYEKASNIIFDELYSNL
ncbi:choline/ethanolamine kinase family protein [Clostridium gasigenes]|uniref:Thiamine kinase n=1 Tax=Clostridium gasigenes TaxID=94869 RepID=A0A1H0NLG5_9CLOT|nr:choline/ethanolamine kinase family protein [Clostridium gasigenes]MBB6623653.1 phosphotransferase family protein [Clostridium gasigenes]MBU3087546.1 phosphotransferase family protein [Clostridium gasigenes]SDO93519.1 Thiamine kinase [Clostridium gasigenes]